MEIFSEQTCSNKEITNKLNSNSKKKPSFYDDDSIQHAPRKGKEDINEDFFACHEIGQFFNELKQEEITQIMLHLFHKIATACQENQEGSTLIIAAYYGDWITIGSIGDSSAFLVEHSSNGNIKCKQINQLHSAENDNERKRIFLIGKHQIVHKRLNGLQPLRTIGDKFATGNDQELSKPDIYHIKVNPLNSYHLILTSDGFTNETVLEENGMGLKSDPDPEGFIQKNFAEITKSKKSISPTEILAKLKRAVIRGNAPPPDDLTIGVIEIIKKFFVTFILDGHGAYKKNKLPPTNLTVEIIKNIMQEFINDIMSNNKQTLMPTTIHPIGIKTWLDQYSKDKLSKVILRLLLLTINFNKTYPSMTKECFEQIRTIIHAFHKQKKQSYQNLFGDIFIIARSNKHFLRVIDKNLYSTLETCSIERNINKLIKHLDYLNITNDFTLDQFNNFSINLQTILNHETLKQDESFSEIKKILNPNISDLMEVIVTICEIHVIPNKKNYHSQPSHRKSTNSKKAASNSLPELNPPSSTLGIFSKSSPALLSYDLPTDLHILLTQFLQKPLYQSLASLNTLVEKHKLNIVLQTLPTIDSIYVDDVLPPNCNT